MLNDKELLKFLAELLTFANTLALSDRAMGVLFNVSHKTMSRWLVTARWSRDNAGAPAYKPYSSMVLEVTNKIQYLDSLNKTTALYSQAISLSRADRMQVLVTALATRRV